MKTHVLCLIGQFELRRLCLRVCKGGLWDVGEISGLQFWKLMCERLSNKLMLLSVQSDVCCFPHHTSLRNSGARSGINYVCELKIKTG